MLPDRLTGIDETSRSSHYYLAEDDRCLYFGEFHVGKGWSGGPTNQLIHNYKRTPREIAESANGSKYQYYKDQAIREIAAGLRHQFRREDVEENYTFVPIPTSKSSSDPEYCDRLERTLREAFSSYGGADIRQLLKVAHSTGADHRSMGDRIRYDDLLAITEIDPLHLRQPVRPTIVLFDDVLTSGKHYRVAKTRILEALPNQQLIAVFVARALHRNPFDEFEDPIVP